MDRCTRYAQGSRSIGEPGAGLGRKELDYFVDRQGEPKAAFVATLRSSLGNTAWLFILLASPLLALSVSRDCGIPAEESTTSTSEFR